LEEALRLPADHPATGQEESETTGPWSTDQLVAEMISRIQEQVRQRGEMTIRVGRIASSNYHDFSVLPDSIARDTLERQVRDAFQQVQLEVSSAAEKFLTWQVSSAQPAPYLSFGIDPDTTDLTQAWIDRKADPGFYSFFFPAGETVEHYLRRWEVIYGWKTTQAGDDHFGLLIDLFGVHYSVDTSGRVVANGEELDELIDELRGRRILHHPAHHWIDATVSARTRESQGWQFEWKVRTIAPDEPQILTLRAPVRAPDRSASDRFDALVRAIERESDFHPIREREKLLYGSLDRADPVRLLELDRLRMTRWFLGDGREWLILSLAPGLWDAEAVLQRFGIATLGQAQASFEIQDLADVAQTEEVEATISAHANITGEGWLALRIEADSLEQLRLRLPAWLGVGAVVTTDEIISYAGLEEEWPGFLTPTDFGRVVFWLMDQWSKEPLQSRMSTLTIQELSDHIRQAHADGGHDLLNAVSEERMEVLLDQLPYLITGEAEPASPPRGYAMTRFINFFVEIAGTLVELIEQGRIMNSMTEQQMRMRILRKFSVALGSGSPTLSSLTPHL